MICLDAGHKYKLATLDGDVDVILTFVKRNEPQEKYPGNANAYPGTTTQEVLRALIDRQKYVNNQKPSLVNKQIIYFLRMCIWLLEYRAAEKKKQHLVIDALDSIEYRETKDDGHLV